jgi:hypothetical protein
VSAGIESGWVGPVEGVSLGCGGIDNDVRPGFNEVSMVGDVGSGVPGGVGELSVLGGLFGDGHDEVAESEGFVCAGQSKWESRDISVSYSELA